MWWQDWVAYNFCFKTGKFTTPIKQDNHILKVITGLNDFFSPLFLG